MEEGGSPATHRQGGLLLPRRLYYYHLGVGRGRDGQWRRNEGKRTPSHLLILTEQSPAIGDELGVHPVLDLGSAWPAGVSHLVWIDQGVHLGVQQPQVGLVQSVANLQVSIIAPELTFCG